VPLAQFGLTAAEREVFEAQILLDEGEFRHAYTTAYQAMVAGARALVRMEFLDVGDDADEVIAEFRTRFVDTELFFDPFAKDKFARYLFRMQQETLDDPTHDDAHRAIEECQLFIEGAFACYNRVSDAEASATA
jgi:sulfite reductase (ferredoxin)